MRCFPLLIFLLLLSTGAWADPLTLSPAAIHGGGVALVRWAGEGGVSGTVHFQDSSIPLEFGPRGGRALIGVDLETPSGACPVRVTVTDVQGEVREYTGEFEILPTEWPEERLDLPSEMVTPKKPEVVERIVAEQKKLRHLFKEVTAPLLGSAFRLPVQDPMGSLFGLRRILNGKPRSPHAGIDFRSPSGTEVHASGRGRVVLAEDLYFTGNTVVLDHGGGLYSLYAHLGKFRCQPGDLLQAGDILGLSGSTGRSTGPHLHWGVKWRGNRIAPLALVKLYGGKDLDSSNL